METVFPECVQNCSHSDSVRFGWDRTRMMKVEPALQADARWQLIERIIASPPFQKSARLRDLLRFLAERTLHGQAQDLSEHNIGSAVFGKAQDYSVVEDSSVRVHVRQLRLKLHEYFDGEGRGETSSLRFQKAPTLLFFEPLSRSRQTEPVTAVVPWTQIPCSSGCHGRWRHSFFSPLLRLGFGVRQFQSPPPPPWPLAALFDSSNSPVQVVVADINYGMMRLVDEQPVTLEQYLSASYRSGAGFTNAHPTPRDLRVNKISLRFPADVVCGPGGGRYAAAFERQLARSARCSLRAGVAPARP